MPQIQFWLLPKSLAADQQPNDAQNRSRLPRVGLFYEAPFDGSIWLMRADCTRLVYTLPGRMSLETCFACTTLAVAVWANVDDACFPELCWRQTITTLQPLQNSMQ